MKLFFLFSPFKFFYTLYKLEKKENFAFISFFIIEKADCISFFL